MGSTAVGCTAGSRATRLISRARRAPVSANAEAVHPIALGFRLIMALTMLASAALTLFSTGFVRHPQIPRGIG